ncbi:hypothetical protein HCJ76_32530 [Streptomyces sp. MC1]|uniref:hypothetical protein n=1 Tax=unclassified Streptomyces TaxID=2593676 RepID=UPI0004C7785E|nr:MULTISPECIES: hypothetical protein [unclassified Streptomyces]MBG7702660.1 hypothetical protein [Streptomyces sp. MC1]
MDSTAGAVIAAAIMLSCTMIVVAALFWFSTGHSRRRYAAVEQLALEQRNLRAEVTEVAGCVRAIQHLLEDPAEP